MPEHGGNLNAAIRRWGIPREQWLDLSTGINPHPWPLPPLPPEVCHRLPEPDDGLEAAARRYYGVEHLLPVPGSQAAITWLPRLRPRCRVGVVSPTYAEHAHHWRLAGHDVHELPAEGVEAALPGLDVLVLVRPNNPDGTILPREQVLAWLATLQARDGWLVVDEAFVDPEPEHSLAPHAGEPGLIILRSFGKFFGLPGLRLGFVLGGVEPVCALSKILGPWPVAGPVRHWGGKAVADTTWHATTRHRLRQDGKRLEGLMRQVGFNVVGGTALFRYALHDDAEAVHEALASLGVWTRLFTAPSALRLGLPGTAEQWDRLRHSLEIVMG